MKMVFCECNCGRKRPAFNKYKRAMRYINGHSFKGKTHTRLSRKKMKFANIGRKHSKETKEKIGLSSIRRKHTEATKEKMRISQQKRRKRERKREKWK